MALQIRRGSDVDRQGIIPKAGEPIFTTDTKKLYIGDGSTAGGIIVDTTTGISNVVEDTSPQLGGNLDLNNNTINGTGNINITGQISASAVDLKGSIFGDDSTLLVDGVNSLIPASVISGTLSNNLNGTVTGNVTGNVTGDLTGNVTGNTTGDLTGNVFGTVFGQVQGDVSGSIFSDDSTLIFDAINRRLLNLTTVTTSTANVGQVIATDNTTYNQGSIFLRRTVSGTISDSRPYGIITFDKIDNDGEVAPVALTAANNYFRIANDPAGVALGSTTDAMHLSWFNNKLGVGYRSPAGNEAVQVNGDIAVTGYIANDQIKIEGNEITTTESNANLELTANGSGTIQLTVPVQTTVGSAGSASALPAQPSTYFKINVAGTDYVVPAYAVS